MELTILDIISFVLFIALVIGISIFVSYKRSNKAVDYFLAGRSLSWWLIGMSLIASNISTEHFVGMAGAGFGEIGLAIASYEWIAAITLVFIALFFLPLFLKLGIYTLPEFLEHRFGSTSRTIMAIYMVIALVMAGMITVIYSGAIGLRAIFDMELQKGIWLIGILAAVYTIYGGLRAVVWSDLVQGLALLLGGIFVMILGFIKVGGVGSFLTENSDKLHLVLPMDNMDIPWTAFLLGIWIPNFFYWGFNQFIGQRALGAKSLREGQKGLMFAAIIKVAMPFIIVFPGIMAYQLYGDKITSADEAYPTLIANILPVGFRGIMFAALFGAIMSSLDSMLNSASTIFTIDIYSRLIKKKSSSKNLVFVGRVTTAICALFACLLGATPEKLGAGVFSYIQQVWGFISPGITTVFFFGIIFRRAPSSASVTALLLGPLLYGIYFFTPALKSNMAFLNAMAIIFVILFAIMWVMTLIKPLAQPVKFKENPDVNVTDTSSSIRWVGAGIIAVVAVIYIIFW